MGGGYFRPCSTHYPYSGLTPFFSTYLNLILRMRIKYLLLLGLLFVFSDCQKDKIQLDDQEELSLSQKKSNAKFINASEISDIFNIVNSESQNHRSLIDFDDDIKSALKIEEIIEEDVLVLYDEERDRYSYAFKVVMKQKPKNAFFNLVVYKESDGSLSDVFLFKYKMDKDFAEEYNSGSVTMSDFRGKIKRFQLKKKKNPNKNDPCGCEQMTFGGSGGGGSSETSLPSGGQGGFTTTCTTTTYTVTCSCEGHYPGQSCTCPNKAYSVGITVCTTLISFNDCNEPCLDPSGMTGINEPYQDETEEEISDDPIDLISDAIGVIRNTIGYTDPTFENWLETNIMQTMNLYASIQSQENKEFNDPILNNLSSREEYIDHTIRIAADLKRMGYGELAQLVGSFVFPMETALGMTNAEVYKLYESAFEMRHQANLHWKGQIMMAVLDPILEISVIAMEELALNAISGPALGVIAKGLGRTARWTGLSRALARVSANLATNGISGFKYAGRFGVDTYSNLSKVFTDLGIKKPDFGPYGVHVHHLIEKRFAETLGVSHGSMKSIVLTPAEHQLFTNAWRTEISTSTSAILNTDNATKVHIEAAARKIYKDYPIILEALGL